MARTIYDIDEKVTGVYSFTIKDENSVAIPGASLTGLTLTLRSAASGVVVNARNAQNALNVNGARLRPERL